MKNLLLAFTALSLVLGATGASADDLSALKQQTFELKKNNEALIRRLEKLEKFQTLQQSAQAPGQAPPPAAGPEAFLAQAAANSSTLLTGSGPLTWKGITVFGTIDAGLGWASSGLPINGKYYQGAEVVNKYATHSYVGVVPNGLSN